MARSDLQETYIAIQQWLTDTSPELWTAVYPDFAHTDAVLPYVVMFWMGGGDANRIRQADPGLVLGVKGVAGDMDTSMRMAARLRALLDNVEDRLGGVYVGENWTIINSMAEQVIHMVEPVDGGFIYHDGNKYRFELQER
jgi:hypothetical protein